MTFHVSPRALDLIESAAGAPSAAEVGRRLFAALQPYGAKAFYARALRSAAPGDAHAFSRISPPRWEQIYEDGRFDDANYMVREVWRRGQPFCWSEVELRTDRERELSQVLVDLRMPDGIGAPVYGPHYVGVTSVAFERLDQIAPSERAAIGVAATVLHHRMLELTPPALVQTPRLTPRERDCIALIAEGKSDWEIGEILGLAETTVMTHVQNVRRKLGARSRAQVIAICMIAGVI
jgi:DNA-binding CsgD family transcriptional regulator